MEIIKVTDLTKQYKQKKMRKPKKLVNAVDNISFSVNQGESIGYVGSNGSGKSTTIKMLTGILQPTSGKILIYGKNPQTNRHILNKKTGVVFGNRSLLWWDVPIIESFNVLKALYEIPQPIYRENIFNFSKKLNIENLLNIPERQLSLGQKMRCNIAAAFLHNPEIVYLDEPTIGLDSKSKKEIREFIKSINESKKTTIFITSHDFQDIEYLCNRIIILDEGKIVYDGMKKDLTKEYINGKQIEIIIKDEFIQLPTMDGTLQGIKVLKNENNTVLIEYDPEQYSIKLLVEYISKYTDIVNISNNNKNIEQIISEILYKSTI